MTEYSIWKYAIPFAKQFSLEMQEGANILSVQYQGDQLCLWAKVKPSASTVVRYFEIVGTGHKTTGMGVHLATVQQGPFVWHVFEVTL